MPTLPWTLTGSPSIRGSQIFKTQMHDAGTYTLRGENRNGSDKVDLDLVVLDTSHDIECEMLKNANLECRCSQSFR